MLGIRVWVVVFFVVMVVIKCIWDLLLYVWCCVVYVILKIYVIECDLYKEVLEEVIFFFVLGLYLFFYIWIIFNVFVVWEYLKFLYKLGKVLGNVRCVL